MNSVFQVRVLGCYGAYPAPQEATAGYLIETKEHTILVDCGSGVISKLLTHKSIGDLTAVIISHEHYDHTADLGILYHCLLLGRKRGEITRSIPIYLPKMEGKIVEDLCAEPSVEVHWIENDQMITLLQDEGKRDSTSQTMTVTFHQTIHPVLCYGMRFTYQEKTLAYSADSAMGDTLFQIGADADLFLCEASMYKDEIEAARQTGHCTSAQAGALAAAVGAHRLALTHLPHHGDLETLRNEASVTYDQEAQLVHGGMVLTIE